MYLTIITNYTYNKFYTNKKLPVLLFQIIANLLQKKNRCGYSGVQCTVLTYLPVCESRLGLRPLRTVTISTSISVLCFLENTCKFRHIILCPHFLLSHVSYRNTLLFFFRVIHYTINVKFTRNMLPVLS